jgi:hypothetical protein
MLGLEEGSIDACCLSIRDVQCILEIIEFTNNKKLYPKYQAKKGQEACKV